MCNCNNNNSLCSRCSSGLSCACPPDYTVLPLPVSCGCCPPGYSWSGATPNWPNGVCTGAGGKQVEPIACNPCIDSTSTDCVTLPSIPCLGIVEGTTLTQFLSAICTPAFWINGLNIIGLDTLASTTFCNLVAACPSIPSSTTPIIGPITPGP